MIVQIYEVSVPEEAIELSKLGVDHMGVLVGNGAFPNEISDAKARAIFDALPPQIIRSALSLSSDLDEIMRVIHNTSPDIIHVGAAIELLSPAQIRKIKKGVPSIRIMRSIPIIGKESILIAKEYENIADFLLLDSHVPGDKQIGAVGRTHDWNISRRIADSVAIPVILAGGLGPKNVSEAIQAVHPAGVDSKTKTDRADGRGKDLAKVKQFVDAAKATITLRK